MLRISILGRFASVLGTELTEADGADGHFRSRRRGGFPDHFQASAQLLSLCPDGVEIWDFDNCYVGPFAEVAPGAVLMPGTILKGNTTIAAGAVIGPDSLLENAVVGEGSTVNASQVYDSTIGERTNVGPFAYIRPGTVVGEICRVGDFVELKNSTIGDGHQDLSSHLCGRHRPG